jgi:hypothetical protein
MLPEREGEETEVVVKLGVLGLRAGPKDWEVPGVIMTIVPPCPQTTDLFHPGFSIGFRMV